MLSNNTWLLPAFEQQLPHPSLRPYIQYYGRLHVPKPLRNSISHLLLPPLGKGVVFGLREHQSVQATNGYFSDTLPPAFILPQGNRSIRLNHAGNIDGFFILFQPGMLRKFFRLPWQQAFNSIIPLPETGDRELMRLWRQLYQATSFAECCHLAETHFMGRLATINTCPDLVDTAIASLQANVNLSVGTIARQLKRSPRHLHRQFIRELGMGPKEFQQLLRLIRAVQVLRKEGPTNLAALSLDLGYNDQAHLYKAFRRYLGVTPRGYLRKQIG